MRGRRIVSRRTRPMPPRRAGPFVTLGADFAWRADDAIDNGTLLTSLPSYVGLASLTLSSGSAQPKKSVSANLGGRYVINATNTGVYANAALLGAAPENITIASVMRFAAAQRACCALVTGTAAVNSGVSQYSHDAGGNSVRSAKLTTPAIHSVAGFPFACVIVSVFTAAGISSYVNSTTPVAAALAGAIAGTQFSLFGLAPGGTFTSPGEWATTAVWTRALSGPEVTSTLSLLGTYYGIIIA